MRSIARHTAFTIGEAICRFVQNPMSRRNEQVAAETSYDMRETPRAANENYGTRSYVPLQVEKLGSSTYYKPCNSLKPIHTVAYVFRSRSLHS